VHTRYYFSSSFLPVFCFFTQLDMVLLLPNRDLFVIVQTFFTNFWLNPEKKLRKEAFKCNDDDYLIVGGFKGHDSIWSKMGHSLIL